MPTTPEIAASQGGILLRSQALADGITSAQVGHLVRSGRWQRLHPGVYLTHNGSPSHLETIWAALAHAGPDAVISHRTAGHAQGLITDIPSLVDVLVPDAHRVTARPGIRVRRSTQLAQRRHPARIPPQTRVEDTTLDLIEQTDREDDVVGWLTKATGRRLTTAARLRAVASGRRRLRHRALVDAVLADVREGVASPLERRYRRGVEAAHGLPRGALNQAVILAGRRRYRDVLYDGFEVSVELDGTASHPVEQLAGDHRRDNESAVAGVLVLRYGWIDVTTHRCRCAIEVAAVLTRRGWTGQLRPCGPGCGVSAARARQAVSAP